MVEKGILLVHLKYSLTFIKKRLPYKMWGGPHLERCFTKISKIKSESQKCEKRLQNLKQQSDHLKIIESDYSVLLPLVC